MTFNKQVVGWLVVGTCLFIHVVQAQPPLPVPSVIVGSNMCYTSTLIRSNVGTGKLVTNTVTWCQGQYTNTNPPPPLNDLFFSVPTARSVSTNLQMGTVIQASTDLVNWSNFLIVPADGSTWKVAAHIDKGLRGKFFRIAPTNQLIPPR